MKLSLIFTIQIQNIILEKDRNQSTGIVLSNYY